MDKIQEKLVELVNNYSALDICLKNEKLGYPEIILFFQYDVPLEHSCSTYGCLKRTMNLVDKKLGRHQDSSCYESVIEIMDNLKDFVIKSDINDSQARIVYKQATDIAEEISNRLKSRLNTAHHTTAHYLEKAAI